MNQDMKSVPLLLNEKNQSEMNSKQGMEWTQMSILPPQGSLVTETTGVSEPQGRNVNVTTRNPHAIPDEGSINLAATTLCRSSSQR